MHSSISNSDARRPEMNYRRLWLLTAAIVFVLVGGAEALLRTWGVSPSLVDDMRLWEYTRNGMLSGEASAKQVIFMGTSRVNLGIDPDVFEKETGCGVLKLGIDGTEVWPLLKDIAENTDFRGTIFYDFRADACSHSASAELAKKYVREYYNDFSNSGKYEKIFNKEIAMLIQGNLAIVHTDPNDLNKVFLPQKARSDNYVVVGRGRAVKAYYRTMLTDKAIAKSRKKRIKEAEKLHSQGPLAYPQWQERMKDIARWTELIQNRGGHVVLVRFPTSGEYWVMDAKVYPREKYWDKIGGLTGATTIHFKDIPGFENIDCPDASHLNYDDAEKFTEYLAGWYNLNISGKK